MPLDLSQGQKDDGEKIRYDLVSPALIHGTSVVLTFGAKKYEAHNWAKGILFSRVYGALQRHLNAWVAGEEFDEETGEPHLWHASCCLMFLIHYTFPPYQKQYSPYDDRIDYANAAQSPTQSGNPEEEFGGACGLGGEDSQPTVTPESRDANRVRSSHEIGAPPPGPARWGSD